MAIEQAIERSGAAAAAVSTAAGGTMSDAALRRVLHGLDGVDQVGAVARTASLATRSIKKTPSSGRSTWPSAWST